MMANFRLPVASLGLVIAAGCYYPPDYCEGAPLNRCSLIDGPPTGCTMSSECAAPTPVCDVTGSASCVQCTTAEAGACEGATPVCGDDHTCRGCVAHSECSTAACLSDGTCALSPSVAYVDPSGTDNATCTQATPCTSVAKALATNRPFVKFKGATDEAVTLNGQDVTFLADPGAKLTRTSNGLLLEVRGASKLQVFDLEISGASGVGNPGISMPTGSTATVSLTRVKLLNNAGGGISASGGTLTIAQSTVSGNAGGGVSVSGGATFAVVGNVFFNNGSQTGSVGGVSITVPQNVANRLEFNSFNKNQVQLGLGSAIHCVAGTFTARNNVMSENGSLTNMEQVGGTCAHTFSIARPGSLPGGIGNSAQDPLFANTTTGDLHIAAGSPARRAADPTSDLTGIARQDIDGDVRVSPADIGADHTP
ncbi:MAG: right-handed parallel beta-helix repeat-containing protein [Deltaproteobacteria bacterium]|nr:right-handed parallel beta-helix repeat-containing protein [Deltaproteobacteria bacterium]